MARKAELLNDIREHLAKIGGDDAGTWRPLRERFPEVSDATFWRAVRKCRQIDTDTVSIAKARQRLADHVAASVQETSRAATTETPKRETMPSVAEDYRRLDLLGKLAEVFDDIALLREYALSDEGRIKNPAIFYQSITMRDRTISTALRYSDAAWAIQEMWDWLDSVVSEITEESPEAGRRVFGRLRLLIEARNSGRSG